MLLRLKRSITVSLQHTHNIAAQCGNGQIHFAVVIQIPMRDGYGLRSGCIGLDGLKCPVPVPQQHSDRVAGIVCHDNVRLTIPIQIRGINRNR